MVFGKRSKFKNVLSYVNDGLRNVFIDLRNALEIETFRTLRHQDIYFQENNEEDGVPTYSMKFYPWTGPDENLIALADEDGNINLKRIAEKSSSIRKVKAHSNAIFDLTWSQSRFLASASGDQTVSVWDASQGDVQSLRTFTGHSRSVKTVEFAPQSNHILASGSRENSILMWDLRSTSNSPDNSIRHAHSSANKNSTCSVTAIKFVDNNTLISCGDADGIVKVWDLRKSYSAYKRDPVPSYLFPHPGSSNIQGFTSLVLDPRSVFVSCRDHKIYRYSLITHDSDPINVYSGYENNSFFVRIALSPDHQYLTSGSSDANAYIWNTATIEPLTIPISKLEAHTTEVTCVDWCAGGWTLATCSDDLKHCLWTNDRNENVDINDIVGKCCPFSPIHPHTPVGNNESNIMIQNENTPSTSSTSKKRALIMGSHGGSSTKKRKTREEGGGGTPSILNFFGSGVKRKNEEDRESKMTKRDQNENKSPINESLQTPPSRLETREPLSSNDNRPSSTVQAARNISKLLDNVNRNPESNTPLKFDKYPCSPTKLSVVKMAAKSPRKLSFSPLKSANFSPTANLPNSVLDRKTPTSSSKKRMRPTDWLTSLSRQKKKKAAKKL